MACVVASRAGQFPSQEGEGPRLKWCNWCGHEKPLSEFWTRKSPRVDGSFIRIQTTYCKACWRWRQRVRARKRMRRPAWLKAYRAYKAKWAREHYVSKRAA